MAALQKVPQQQSIACAGSYGSGKADAGLDQFPAGLRVMVVDDDVTCLKILEHMLRRCMYQVTSFTDANAALNMLRERKGSFDMVLSDVHMPAMNGFKLLELVGLEMDLPVIMISADMSVEAVMKGIKHGACDYLIKPIREEELKNIWQHVVRKKWIENKDTEQSGSLEDNGRQTKGGDEVEYAASVNEGADITLRGQRKRKEITEEDDGDLENDDPTTSKKQRVVWSVELHQQFVSAVNQLGIDKAVPKRILELMNVPGLTRENVASHLQKFRLYLKKLSGVAQQQCGIPNSFGGPPVSRFDVQALAASGQIPPQTLAALHAELYGRPASSLILPAVDQQALLQASLQGQKCIPESTLSFGQPPIKCQPNLSISHSQSIIPVEEVSPRSGAWTSNNVGTVCSPSNPRGLNTQTGNVLAGTIQHQHQHHQQRQRHQLQQQHFHQQLQQHQQQMSMLPELNRSINVLPSCLVAPSRSLVSYQAGNSPSSVDQNCNFNRSSGINYNLLSPRSDNSSLGIGHALDGNFRATGVLSGYSAPDSMSPSVSSCSMHADTTSGQQPQHSALTYGSAKQLQGVGTSIGGNEGHSTKSSQVLDQGPLRNLGFVGKGTHIPSRFAVDDLESPTSNLTSGAIYGENNGNRVKQEQNLAILENDRAATLPNFSNDLMGVFSD